MPNISISDLKATGTELFVDPESFMKDMNDNEFTIVNGGQAIQIGPFPFSKLCAPPLSKFCTLPNLSIALI